jgi:hypothetical protein
MIRANTWTRVAGLSAALLVNAVMFFAADRSISSAGPVLVEDDPVVQFDRVVITADHPARTASTSELSSDRAL